VKTNICFLIVIIPILTGCSKLMPSEPTLDSAIDGRTIVYSSNQHFTLDLEEDYGELDSGDQWQCFISDTNVVRIDSTRFVYKKYTEYSGYEIETFCFHAIQRGRSAVIMTLGQSWYPDYPPLKTVKFFIIVI
jgi:hypothetical protein